MFTRKASVSRSKALCSDWASHGNDIEACVGAVASGDAAFRAFTGWVESHGGWDDMALIGTSDHGHMFELEKPKAFAR